MNIDKIVAFTMFITIFDDWNWFGAKNWRTYLIQHETCFNQPIMTPKIPYKLISSSF